ncbi:MAG: hypothetical protein FWC92_09695 [Defluviitaleaceae bacterium]|nr:hypothetical protein [Defluviitaleaceae bacterium]
MQKKIISYAFIVLAVFLIVIGIIQSGFLDTFRRAVVICLECVGIG